VDRYSLLVRLFHPLPHAGLSRRTNIATALTILDFGEGKASNSLPILVIMYPPMEELTQRISHEIFRICFFGALIALVVITSILGRPKRLATSTDFPAPLGAKLIAWALITLWMMLLVAALGVRMYWLAAIFAIGPAYTIWRWPETISIDELQISRYAWCHPRVSIRWNEIESIFDSRDVFVLRGQTGAAIRISTYQVGAAELAREIGRHTGIDVFAIK